MKLLKIGSSPACDIVINSQYVSGHHADITILDNGEILIEDKGSKNGTFYGPQKKRLAPGQETKVNRGDKITFADTDLVWSQVPGVTSNAMYSKIINIGSNFRNDLVVSGPSVSRYHATVKIDKKGHAFIVDNNSTNGTQVNGIKVTPNQPTRIKRGDNIVVGDNDITIQLSQIIGWGQGDNSWLKGLGIAACVALLCVIGWVVYPILFPKDIKSGIIYVHNRYHYNLTLKENPYNLPIKFETGSTGAEGTAFFLDKEGRIGTARHLAMPWLPEYSKRFNDELKKEWNDYISSMYPTSITTKDQLDKFMAKNKYATDILEAADFNIARVNVILKSIHNSPVEISGESDAIYIGYPGRYYENYSEFDRAVMVSESGTADADVALLQLNSKKTPAQIKNFVNIQKFDKKRIVPMKEEVKTIGYPSGIVRAMDFKAKTMEPTQRTSRIAKAPSKFTTELQDNTAGGQSGSPVFYKDGTLVGIISEKWVGDGGTTTIALGNILKDLYDKEVK